MKKSSYYRYWGKAKRDKDEPGEPYHLLVYHSLDVAAVGQVLLEKHHLLRKRLATLMNLPEKDAVNWCVFLLGIHDLGKFSESFQQLRADLRIELWPQEPIKQRNYNIRHDSLGEMLWNQKIRKTLFCDDEEALTDFIEDTLKYWLNPVFGHHGWPPSQKERIKHHFSPFDQSAALEFFQQWQQLRKPNFSQAASLNEQEIWEKAQRKASWLLAGIAVLCDWLGSDQEIFKYKIEKIELEDYWEKIAIPSAVDAIDKSGVLPKEIKMGLNLKDLFPFISSPTPLQQICLDIPVYKEPQIYILEDVTGAGKTEAALILAHRLLAQGQADGLYIGLPTMATANAMYERMTKTYQKLYADGVLPSLILSHSARHLSEKFQQSLLDAHKNEQNYIDEENITAQCNRWLADNRKKALLADVGIGTIDQALLGVLPARHQSLRLLGLLNKVLILDEVHAYDAYTSQLLKRLVKFHAALGGSIILLSATLTKKQREELLQAFYGKPRSEEIVKKTDYPLLTHVPKTTDNKKEYPLETRESVKRKVNVTFCHEEKEVMTIIKAAVAEGKCVCWIRNTVPDAREAWQQLNESEWLESDKLHLFHSRYTLHDRLSIENRMLNYFGKSSASKRRNGRVLIATQVVEQSLDLDFDIMISDLAPIDLLIQRAGRLQRHNRNKQGDILDYGEADQRDTPVLHIYSPKLTDTPNQDWFKDLLPKADFVYPHTLILWRTSQILHKNRGWHMPEDARELLEYVYEDDGEIPEGLNKNNSEAIGDEMSLLDMGDFTALKLETGYNKNDKWDEEARVATRLGEDTHTIYLARWQDGKLTSWIEEGFYSWDLSSLRVNKEQLKELAPVQDEGLSIELQKLKEETSLFDDDSFILPLHEIENGYWQGTVYNIDSNTVIINYQVDTGLSFTYS